MVRFQVVGRGNALLDAYARNQSGGGPVHGAPGRANVPGGHGHTGPGFSRGAPPPMNMRRPQGMPPMMEAMAPLNVSAARAACKACPASLP